MLLGVVSDIHGNLRALEAVADDLARQAPDAIVNLGDCASGPLQPGATLDLLRHLAWPTVRGNHDRTVLLPPAEIRSASDAHAAPHLTAGDRSWLAGLPLTLSVEGALLCHGTPTDDCQYLLEVVEATGARPAAPSEVRQILGDVRAPLVLCGHTHVPRTCQVGARQLVVNPGSVGLPAYADSWPHPHAMEAGTPHARYALVDTVKARVEHRAVRYDWSGAASDALAAGFPDWAHALATGVAAPR